MGLSYSRWVKLLVLCLFFFLFYSIMPAFSPGRPVSNVESISLLGEKSRRISPSRQNAVSSNSSWTWTWSWSSSPIVHLWCTVVRIGKSNSAMTRKFKVFVESLTRHSNRSLSLNIISDAHSRLLVERVLNAVAAAKNGSAFHRISFYDIDSVSEKIAPIVAVMRRYFSSVPGTYYSDSLFYVSLGLHEIAPEHHDQVILLDIDTKLETSIFSLFDEFSEFGEKTLFGLAPELTPVYRHILWKWKQTNSSSPFGEPSYRGYSGLNSGVMLLRLNAIRRSQEYRSCITRAYVDRITSKYFFKGHLGDQDFYTLLGMEKPHLIFVLSCTWNKQLCQWWKYHGYTDVFDDFARCSGQINIYHGNCNTPVPIQ